MEEVLSQTTSLSVLELILNDPLVYVLPGGGEFHMVYAKILSQKPVGKGSHYNGYKEGVETEWEHEDG